MSEFTGTAALLRLALRLDRVRLSVWVAVLALLPVATASQYQKLYPDEASIRAVSGVLSNPSLEAIGGPLFALTLGGLTEWKISATIFILAALMSLMTVVRHSRTEEETGRLELLGSTVIGRQAPLTAALLTAGIADIAAGTLIALLLIGIGLPAAGSLALGASAALAGIIFAAIAAVTAQFVDSARSATAAASAVLGVAYLLRAIADTGPSALNWVSPLGWLLHMRPYASERWWVIPLALGFSALLIVGAYGLRVRRDVGAGLLPDRPAPAAAGPSLGSPLGLAWRLQRGLLIGWSVGMFVGGIVFGGVGKSVGDGVNANQQMKDYLAKLGGPGVVADQYLGAAVGILGLSIAAYTVQAILRLRSEEAAGRAEPLLATGVSRWRWAASHLIVAFGGTAVILALAGAGAGLAYGGAVGDLAAQFPRLFAAALVQIPAAWVLAGFGMLVIGLVPRLSSLAWAALVACVALLEVGLLLGLPQWAVDISPFAHVPKLPGGTFTATPVAALVVVAAALTVVGLAGLRRRDIG